MNPIEGVWSWLKERLAKSRSQLKNENYIWDELDKLTDQQDFKDFCK